MAKQSGIYIEEGKEKRVAYSVFTLGNSNAAVFSLYAPAKDFAAFQPKFEGWSL